MTDATPEHPRSGTGRVRQLVLLTAGTIALALGVVGIFIPLLPTTPFLLLAAACFTRSSRRLHDWLLGHRVLGTYIRNYREHRAISLGTKITSIALMWTTTAYGVLVGLDHWVLRGLLVAVAIGVTVHLLSLTTATREMIEAPNPHHVETTPTAERQKTS